MASIIDVYERLGSVEGALAFIRKFREGGMASGKGNVERSAADKAPWLLLEAQLLDRAGRADEAIAIFEQLRQNGLAMPDALRLATLHLKKGNLPFALRALKAARTEGDSFNKDYWALLADVAYDAGEQATAEQALDQLIKNAKPAAYQAERAIRLRTDTNRIDEALRMAALLYQRFPEDLIVFAWLDALNAQKNPAGLSDLMMALKNTHRQSLEASTAFLERRAGLYARLGNIQLAKRDYTQALMLAPDNPNLRAAYWWLLVDQQETALLRGEIGRINSTQRRNPAYSGVLTVAWQLLGEPRQALALMQRETRARSNDFLWLMNYADVLEQADRQSAALRVRRHAWLLAGRTLAKPEDAARAKNALLTQLRLAGDFAGGSAKAKLWRELGVLVNTSQASQDPTQKQQANELVAAWLLSSGRFDAAQRWLWQQHAARLAVPAYQQLALALAQNDKVALAAILEMADKKQTREQVNSLSPQDRLSALRELGRLDESASLGTEQALRRAEGLDDEAQQALQRDLLATASRANVRLRTRQDADLTRQEIATSVSVVLNPQLRLTLDLNNTTNSSRNPALIAATPRLDREVRVGLKATTPWGDITAQAATRDAVARVNGLYLQYGMPLNKQSTLQLEAALNERSEESSAMAITGVRSRVGAKLNLQANAALQSELYLGRNQFRTQTGVTLGSSLDASVNANWTLRRDYPDVRLQSQLRRSVMRAIGQPDAAASVLSPGGVLPGVNLFLGPSSTAFSTSVGVGLAQSDPSVYSRAWRPWGELGFETRQTMGIRQTQGLLRLGGKGTVLGRDQLSIHLDLRPGTGGLSGTQGTRELRLQYDIYFDQ